MASINRRTIVATVMILLAAGCASRPADVDCREGIEHLEYLDERSGTGGILIDELRSAIGDAKKLEGKGDYETCKKVASRARVRMEVPVR